MKYRVNTVRKSAACLCSAEQQRCQTEEEEKAMNRIKKAFSVFLAVCMTLMQMLCNGAFVLPAYADTVNGSLITPEITVTAPNGEVGRWEYIDITMPADATGEFWVRITSEEGYSRNSLHLAEDLDQGKLIRGGLFKKLPSPCGRFRSGKAD